MNAENIRVLAAALSARTPRQSLAPTKPWDPELSQRILNAGFASAPGAKALQAGLLLWNDDLHASHTIAQEIETDTGSLWHGIMHRMEGDYSNAKYWFRRTGNHPVFPAVANKASETINDYIKKADGSPEGGGQTGGKLAETVRNQAWNPYMFTDCVEQGVLDENAGRAHRSYIEALERIQQDEIEALLSYCFHQVFGGTLFDS